MEPCGPRSADEEAAAADLISKLPSDVLVSILERLHLRDAVRAGALSSRWRCLPKQLPRLSLDIDDFLPRGQGHFFDDRDTGEDDEGDDVAAADDVLSEAGDKMVRVATALLASRSPAPANAADAHVIATLAMKFHLRRQSCYMSLGRLVDHAVASGKVRAAELTITTKSRTVSWSEDEDREARRALLRGYGRRFRNLFDACPAAFGALKQLTIESVKLGKHDFPNILDTCTRLEKLYLFSCVPGPGGLWQVRHERLTDIRISLCGIHGVSLEWVPRLKQFAFQGWFSMTHQLLSFSHVPCLTTVTLSHDNGHLEETLKLSRIMANTAVKDIRLNFRGNNIWVQPESSRRLIDLFRNLTNLKIRNVHHKCGLSWTMFLLQSAPHLQELYIKLTDHECGVVKKNVPWEVPIGFKHYTLARITILGFYSNEETVVTYIRHLLQAAINLEEIDMRENATYCEICGHMEPKAGSRFPRTDEDKETFRKRITTNGRSAIFKICIRS
ncbi:unnamed protein product [Urochloa decumbens]|uniref:F-box domain-containing protein n=1 Tax=Urochloa decumbens TaxID=240449 RepID=A0ABC9B8L4_9POAL